MLAEKTLLITNNPLTTSLVKKTLRSHPDWGLVFIDQLPSVDLALKELSVRSYDLILIDCSSLNHSPLESVFEIRRLKKEVPLIVLNRPGLERTAIACIKHGADYYQIMDQKWEEELPSVMSTVMVEIDKKKSIKQKLTLLEEENKKLKSKSLVDEDTFFYSSPYFRSIMSRELKRASRHDLNLSCLVLDVGTSAQVIKKIRRKPLRPVYEKLSLLLKSLVRESDVWARLAENRFAALLPHTTAHQAKTAITRLNSEIGENKFHLESTEIPISLRWGLAEFSKKKTKNEQELLKQAEASLQPWS